MNIPKLCCTLQPVTSNYTPKGKTFEVDGMSVYETTGSISSSTKVLICGYDGFGVHPNIRQFSDILAQAGFKIAIPDFFRGHSISLDYDFEKGGMEPIMDFVEKYGTWSNTVKRDFISVVQHYKSLGVTDFGVFGFCWGGGISIDASTEIPDIKAAGLVHPSFWSTEDAEGMRAATILVPTKDEADMIPFYEILKKNLGEEECEHHRFDDMYHGFCGARGDFNDEAMVEGVNEVISLLQNFFGKHV